MLSLLTSQACGTFLSPDFYKEQLREADAYTFLYDELLTTAIDDALETGDDLPPGVDLEAGEIVASLREAVPADWLQEQVEGAIDSAGPYLLGGADSFTYSINLDERSGAAEAAALSLLDRIDLHEALFAEEIPETVEDRLSRQDELPLGIMLTQDEAVAAVGRVVTPAFVRSQQSAATAALAAYLVGRSDTFAFTIDFTPRTTAVENELRNVFDDADVESYVREEVLEPALGEHVAADVAMPLGVVVTREEIRAAIEAAATPEWLRVETLRLVDGIVPYLSARQDGFNLTVPLVERTDVAIRELSKTVEENYGRLFATVSQCTPAQLRELAQGRAVELCTPPGFTTRDILGVLGIDIERSLAGPVHEMAPDAVTFTDADLLEETLGTPAGDTILDLRETMSGGLSIDEAGLREALAEQDEGLPDALDTLREGFQQGWDWTEEDLRGLLDDPEALDQARSAVGLFRLLSVLVSAVAVAMVAGGGFLGGQTWGGKLGWAGGVLAFAALVTFIATGPVYGALGSGALDEARADARSERDGAEELAFDKLLDTAEQATDDFVGGIRLRALLLLVLGVGGVAGGVYLSFRRIQRALAARAAGTEPEPAAGAEEGAASAGETASEADSSPQAPPDGSAPAEAEAPAAGDTAGAEESAESEAAPEEEPSQSSLEEDAPEATDDASSDSGGDGTQRPPST